MSTNHKQEVQGRGGVRGSGSDARTAAPASAPSSNTNTGRKVDEGDPLGCSESAEGIFEGERLEFFTTGTRSELVRHPVPKASAPDKVALVDFLSFTLTPPAQIALVSRIDGLEDAGFRWVVGELGRLFNVPADRIERKKTGRFGFKYSASFGGGLIAWGGASQRSRIMVSFSGEGCARIEDWPKAAAWLEGLRATLTRVDLAHDDFASETVSMAKAVKAYESGGFNTGGRKPEHQLAGDWLDGEQATRGRTLYVGSRDNGKLFRAYEKGKQLGDESSRWVRVECEWHHKSRLLPYDMLTRPGQYLAGAFPWLSFLHAEQCRVRTTFRAAKVAFDRAMHHARQQVGKLVNFALAVYEGDYAKVVEELRREGIPARIEPYSYHVRERAELLANDACMSPGYCM